MNKVIIVDASESDRRLMSSLLVKHGYKPIAYIVRFRVNSIASLPVTPSIVISMTVTTLRNLLISTVGSIPSLYFSESFCKASIFSFSSTTNRALPNTITLVLPRQNVNATSINPARIRIIQFISMKSLFEGCRNFRRLLLRHCKGTEDSKSKCKTLIME